MAKRIQPRRGDIFMADLVRDPLYRKRGMRPVLIIQNNKGNANSCSVIAVPITSRRKKSLPTHVILDRRCGVKRESIALCEDIMTIEKRCLLDYIGTIINTAAEAEVNEALRISIALDA